MFGMAEPAITNANKPVTTQYVIFVFFMVLGAVFSERICVMAVVVVCLIIDQIYAISTGMMGGKNGNKRVIPAIISGKIYPQFLPINFT